jgi:hypothetical protein
MVRIRSGTDDGRTLMVESVGELERFTTMSHLRRFQVVKYVLLFYEGRWSCS